MPDDLPLSLEEPPLKAERLAMLRERGVGRRIEVVSDYRPAGDQPQAIDDLTEGMRGGERSQVLLGVTGSGKTFTMAHVIRNMQRPGADPGAQQDAGGPALTAR